MTVAKYIAVLFVLAAPVPASAADWMARLGRGEILVYSRIVRNSSTQEVVVKAVIEAAPERVWRLISRCNDFTWTMPRIKKSRELSRKGNRIVCSTTVDMPFPYSDLTATIEAVHTFRKGYWARRWELIRGDYSKYRGSWVLTHFQGHKRRTMMVYRAHVKPRAWIPDWIRRGAQKRSLPEMIKKFRKLAKQKPR